MKINYMLSRYFGTEQTFPIQKGGMEHRKEESDQSKIKTQQGKH
jgi:hypothetical protein